jgi:hypothetical protein
MVFIYYYIYPHVYVDNGYTVVLTLNPAAPENGIIFSLPQAVPAGQIKSFAIPQQKETIN